jgi:hypothetical protein
LYTPLPETPGTFFAMEPVSPPPAPPPALSTSLISQQHHPLLTLPALPSGGTTILVSDGRASPSLVITPSAGAAPLSTNSLSVHSRDLSTPKTPFGLPAPFKPGRTASLLLQPPTP